MNQLQVPFVILLIMIGISSLVIGKQTGWKYSFILVGMSLVGITYLVYHPILLEEKIFEKDKIVEVKGRVIKEHKNLYYREILLDDVELRSEGKRKKISSQVSVQLSNYQKNYVLQDKILVKGKVLKPPIQMNPSDMNYLNYLRGEKIIAKIKEIDSKKIGEDKSLRTTSYIFLTRRIEELFKGKDYGITAGVLLGNKEGIDEEVKELYYAIGIGHLLALSGFHIGIISLIIFWICKKIGIAYYARYLISLVGIWGYALFTGGATSTIRACMMMSVVLIGRCLWEEEDIPTSIALASLIVLIANPFELNQVGFQITFLSVISLYIGETFKKFLEEIYQPTKVVKTIINMVMPLISIALGIAPVIAYHFFEVPFLANLLNLIMIPIFTLLIPCMLVCIGISFIHMGLALIMSKMIIYLLYCIKIIGENIEGLPLMTLCIGRPSWISIIGYYIVLIYLLLGISKKIAIKEMIITVCNVCIIYIGIMLSKGNVLELTQLYVGQGDAAVVIMPKRKAFLIDGGPSGKGKIIEKFLKYKGINRVTGAIVSHPHDDHIGGIIELIGNGIMIENILIPSGCESDELIEQLYGVCNYNNIPIYEIDEGAKLKIDEMELTCLGPDKNEQVVDANENSAVVLLKFNKFKALFTGDIGKATEDKIKESVGDINVLKIAHHGSKTSTSKDFLLQTRPEYAMISCGINNLYGHPHEETMDTLSKYPIDIFRTDQDGAITIYTDGIKYLDIDSYIQEVKEINEGDL